MEHFYAPLAHTALPLFDAGLERSARRARRNTAAVDTDGRRQRFKRGRRAA